jgi:hypothetical protein
MLSNQQVCHEHMMAVRIRSWDYNTVNESFLKRLYMHFMHRCAAFCIIIHKDSKGARNRQDKTEQRAEAITEIHPHTNMRDAVLIGLQCTSCFSSSM